MTHLRELLLNNNALRSLPYELGKLFLLQVRLNTLTLLIHACLVHVHVRIHAGVDTGSKIIVCLPGGVITQVHLPVG